MNTFKILSTDPEIKVEITAGEKTDVFMFGLCSKEELLKMIEMKIQEMKKTVVLDIDTMTNKLMSVTKIETDIIDDDSTSVAGVDITYIAEEVK